jgi:hypothetical protein
LKPSPHDIKFGTVLNFFSHPLSKKKMFCFLYNLYILVRIGFLLRHRLNLESLLDDLIVDLELGRDRQVDVSVAELDDEATDQTRVDTGLELERVALLDKCLQHALQLLELSAVQRLGGGDTRAHLTSVRAHQRREVVGNAAQTAQATVLGQQAQGVDGERVGVSLDGQLVDSVF